MNETSKAMRRRWSEDVRREFPWKKLFQGRMIDIGCGPDPIPFNGVVKFDMEDGDANRISDYFKDEFDLVHASQCLEHMNDPALALSEWIKICKKGGHLVVSVPDLGMYESFIYPSKHNPDHKCSFSMLYPSSPFPHHCFLPSWLDQFKDRCEVVLCRYVERNYDWSKDRSIDQTWEESAGVEIWNEFVLKKL